MRGESVSVCARARVFVDGWVGASVLLYEWEGASV